MNTYQITAVMMDEVHQLGKVWLGCGVQDICAFFSMHSESIAEIPMGFVMTLLVRDLGGLRGVLIDMIFSP